MTNLRNRYAICLDGAFIRVQRNDLNQDVLVWTDDECGTTWPTFARAAEVMKENDIRGSVVLVRVPVASAA